MYRKKENKAVNQSRVLYFYACSKETKIIFQNISYRELTDFSVSFWNIQFFDMFTTNYIVGVDTVFYGLRQTT